MGTRLLRSSKSVTGKSPNVSYSQRRGLDTTWTIVELGPFQREFREGRREREKSGYKLKVRASEGPFAGWYLGRVGRELVPSQNGLRGR